MNLQCKIAILQLQFKIMKFDGEFYNGGTRLRPPNTPSSLNITKYGINHHVPLLWVAGKYIVPPIKYYFPQKAESKSNTTSKSKYHYIGNTWIKEQVKKYGMEARN